MKCYDSDEDHSLHMSLILLVLNLFQLRNREVPLHFHILFVCYSLTDTINTKFHHRFVNSDSST